MVVQALIYLWIAVLLTLSALAGWWVKRRAASWAPLGDWLAGIAGFAATGFVLLYISLAILFTSGGR
ncbi:MAG: hypothetical protein KGP27_03230 [Hyphomicrobiales bacterium]|nr:hypothetical protein [Hyphomicrobiales bacterium]